MKICAYVQTKYAKQTYKNESYNTRLFAGIAVVIDILRRAGHAASLLANELPQLSRRGGKGAGAGAQGQHILSG